MQLTERLCIECNAVIGYQLDIAFQAQMKFYCKRCAIAYKEGKL